MCNYVKIVYIYLLHSDILQAAAFYPNQQHSGAPGHPSSIVSLQQLTQRLDILQPPPVAQHTPPTPAAAKTPPVAASSRQTKPSSKSRAAAAAGPGVLAPTHPGIALPGYGYPTHGVAASQRSAAGQVTLDVVVCVVLIS